MKRRADVDVTHCFCRLCAIQKTVLYRESPCLFLFELRETAQTKYPRYFPETSLTNTSALTLMLLQMLLNSIVKSETVLLAFNVESATDVVNCLRTRRERSWCVDAFSTFIVQVVSGLQETLQFLFVAPHTTQHSSHSLSPHSRSRSADQIYRILGE